MPFFRAELRGAGSGARYPSARDIQLLPRLKSLNAIQPCPTRLSSHSSAPSADQPRSRACPHQSLTYQATSTQRLRSSNSNGTGSILKQQDIVRLVLPILQRSTHTLRLVLVLRPPRQIAHIRVVLEIEQLLGPAEHVGPQPSVADLTSGVSPPAGAAPEKARLTYRSVAKGKSADFL